MNKEQLLQLNTEFEGFLNTLSAYCTQDLIRLLETETLFNYLDGKSFEDVHTLCFEYQYEIWNISLFVQDKAFRQVCETIELPTTLNFKTGWPLLVPEPLYRRYQKIEQVAEIEEIITYQQRQEVILIQWFQACWDAATAKRRARIDAYFSMHDSSIKTDLNTGKELNLG